MEKPPAALGKPRSSGLDPARKEPIRMMACVPWPLEILMSGESMVKKAVRRTRNAVMRTTKVMDRRYEISKAVKEAMYPRDQSRVISPLNIKMLIEGVDFVLPLC